MQHCNALVSILLVKLTMSILMCLWQALCSQLPPAPRSSSRSTAPESCFVAHRDDATRLVVTWSTTE